MGILRASVKRVAKFFLWFVAVIVLLVGIFIVITRAYGSGACVALPVEAALSATSSPLVILHAADLANTPGYLRSEQTSLLTFPEWYIVYSAREFSGYLAAGGKPSGFPYFRSIAQFWCGYGVVHRYNATHYPQDLWGNVEIVTIGASYSTEYFIKGLYENTFGRVSEWFTGEGQTDEDIFFSAAFEKYARSLDVTPWYRYPFFPTITELWRETSLWGPHPVRKWERKTALSVGFAVEGVWGFLMEKATNDTGVYPPAATEIQLLVAWPLPVGLASDPRVRLDKEFGDGTAIVTVPRYQEFTDVMRSFAAAHVELLDIAGAHGLLTTVFSSSTLTYALAGVPLFIEQLPTDPHTRRTGTIVPVTELLQWIRSAEAQGLTIEHVYDI